MRSPAVKRLRAAAPCGSDAAAAASTVALLQRRETGLQRRGRAWRFGSACRRDRFRRLRVLAQADSCDAETAAKIRLPFLKRRSAVVEMMVAGNYLLVLTATGVCAAFTTDTLKRVAFLNMKPDEVIRSLFHNKANASVITVSVYRHDNFSSLRCRSTSLSYGCGATLARCHLTTFMLYVCCSDIASGQVSSSENLFESESLRYPGFVEFDEINSKVLTFSACSNRRYTVWEMKGYSPLYSIQDPRIQEVKLSLGVMLLIYKKAKSHIDLRIVDIESGKTLQAFKHLLHRQRSVEFIELFSEKLLLKEKGENLYIFDVRTRTLQEIANSDFATPSAFIYLYQNQLFLTFHDGVVNAWNFQGQLVTRFQDHRIFNPECQTTSIFISRAQDFIISHCVNEGDTLGSINISNIFTGECLGKACCSPSSADAQVCARALSSVSALCYCSRTNTIFTGSEEGIITSWGS